MDGRWEEGCSHEQMSREGKSKKETADEPFAFRKILPTCERSSGEENSTRSATWMCVVLFRDATRRRASWFNNIGRLIRYLTCFSRNDVNGGLSAYLSDVVHCFMSTDCRGATFTSWTQGSFLIQNDLLIGTTCCCCAID